MTRKSKQSDNESAGPPPGFVLGEDLTIEEMDYNRIAVSPEGQATFYLGYLGPRSEQPSLHPLSIAARQKDVRRSHRFVHLLHGGLFMSSFLWNTHYYKILPDRRLRLPSGANATYGVFHQESWKLDEGLTRQLFGATQAELDEFLTAFVGAVRVPVVQDAFEKTCCTTFSKTRDNSCDLTNQFIPKGFPYIRFGDTNVFGGHISLYGLYQQLALLCHYVRVGDEIVGEGFFQLLVDHGGKPEAIVRLAKAGVSGPSPPLLDLVQLHRFTWE